MPTLPSSGSPSPESPPAGRESHQAREIAESFGTDAERYDRARPSYPGALVQRIVAASPGPEVLDVGIGTGIAARQFRAAGCGVLGVDPDERMADLARRSGLEVEAGTFEAWDPAGRVFDAVVAATAWHWVDPVAGAAKAARVLRPGGLLAVFWNSFALPDDLAAAFAAVYDTVMPDSPVPYRPSPGLDAYRTLCEKAADGFRQAGVFGEPAEWHVDWQRSYSRDEWLDQVPTSGLHTRLPRATLTALLAGIGAAVDTAGGSFPVQCRTVAVTATRA